MTLVSDYYRDQLVKKHAQKSRGGAGKSHAAITAFAETIGAKTILDDGCGRGTLKHAIPQYEVAEYVPGIPGKDGEPTAADLVVSTDVVEHIEPDNLDAVLAHIKKLGRLGTFLLIATALSRAILPDGRNSHLIVQKPGWWLQKLKGHRFKVDQYEVGKGLLVWTRA